MATLPASGIVDGDGHVLEPAWLWDHYVDERFRDRAIHVRVNDEGLEYIEFDGQPFSRLRPGSLSLLGAMGEPDAQAGPDRRYMESMPLGACDPVERLQLLDKQGLDAAVLYPLSASSGRSPPTTSSSPTPCPGPTTAGSPTSAGSRGTGWLPSPI